ncbi:MAG: hypothetical protein V4713_03845 [Pseudomonadota bacterium]
MKTCKQFLLLIVSTLAFCTIGANAATARTTQVGQSCKDEATINDLMSDEPMICTDGKWSKVVFKTSPDGSTNEQNYAGKCALRFDAQTKQGEVVISQRKNMADICLPDGWKFLVVASDNTYDWQFNAMRLLPNVMLAKASAPGKKSTLWIYATDAAGKLVDKIEVTLRSVK